MSAAELAELRPGLRGEAGLVVSGEHTAPRVGSGAVSVLATPVMINLMEAAALAAVERFLPPGYQSLGTVLNVRHIAATPVGMRVQATAIVQAVDGRTIRLDRKSTRLNSSHVSISYAVFCLKKKKI